MPTVVPDSAPTSLLLEPDVRSVGIARRMLHDVMARSGAADHADAAAVALSELVTNALVHTGDEVTVLVWSSAVGTRVEVEDSSQHLPVRRQYADTAGTGRGMHLVEQLTDRWGARRRNSGKTVWFELGEVAGADPGAERTDPSPASDAVPDQARVHPVTLRSLPLLMHWAWQEHAAALLREYLLHVLDEDDTVLDQHAQASEAMSLLSEQVPAPHLPDDPDELMAGALEPHVTAEEVVLQVPAASVPHFATLDDLLRRAAHEARAGHFLGPPTQPEIEEMRAWICTEVARQTAGSPAVTPWLARTDVRATTADQADAATVYASLASVEEPLLATDEASVVVAASPAALELLGYARAEDLLGRRVLVVVPARFHQAHIAGTTLNATNGRDTLLGVPLVVPMVRADGTEMPVRLQVRSEQIGGGRRAFVARFRPA